MAGQQIEAIKMMGGLKALKSKKERLIEAIEKGLQVPWLGVRPDLILHRGAPQEDGKPTYIIEDPVTGNHYELGEDDAKLFLFLIADTDLGKVVDNIIRHTALTPSANDIVAFLKRMQREKLAVLPTDAVMDGIHRRFEHIREKGPPRRFSLIKIFFFMIPLFRPDAFLTAIYPWLKPLWSKPFLYLYGVLGIVGLISALQQIELYWHTAAFFLTPKGILAFFLCLAVVKILHELGHAMAAKHHGIYVRRMGIYMMFFTPMLFTDASEAWKLPTRRARLLIGGAGVLVEFYLACVSLFFWSVLPDGLLRSLMFYVSSVSLLSTMFVNVNPFMRFDGYYILMDYLRISNLRTRSRDLMKHYARKLFVDWRGPKPEENPHYKFMIIYAICSYIYILAIMISINLVIYATISKALGVWGIVGGFLIFFGGGLVREIADIIKNPQYWGSKWRVAATLTVFGLLIYSVFMPMTPTEKLPGLFVYKDVVRIETPNRGQILTPVPEPGDFFHQGQVLVRIENDFLEQMQLKAYYDLQQVEANILNLVGGGEQGAYRNWLLAERERLQAAQAKIQEGLEQLTIKAPITGRVLEVDERLRQGSSVGKGRFLLTMSRMEEFEVRAYASEKIYQVLTTDNMFRGRILVKDLETRGLQIEFREKGRFPVMEFPNETLFDFMGGDIMTYMTPAGEVRPRFTHYPLMFNVLNPPPYLKNGMRCMIEVRGEERRLIDTVKKELWRLMSEEGVV